MVLLFVVRQLFQDGKEKDKALAEEKDKRLSDALASQQAVFTANLIAINRRYKAHAGLRITDV